MKNALLTFVFVFLLSGCQSTSPNFNVNVDSISAPESNQLKRYVLLSENKGVLPDSLQFLEYGSYVERALAEQGFVKAADFDDADLAIFVGYGIGEPRSNSYTYTIPTYGRTGISSSTTNSTVSVYGNTATVNSNTTYRPSYGINGSTTHSGTYTTYSRYLSLTGIDLNQYRIDEQGKEIWRTTITSTGSSGDLRKVLPVMVAAAKPYLSKNTGQMITVSITEDDEQVLSVKGLPVK